MKSKVKSIKRNFSVETPEGKTFELIMAKAVDKDDTYYVITDNILFCFYELKKDSFSAQLAVNAITESEAIEKVKTFISERKYAIMKDFVYNPITIEMEM